MAKLVSKIVEIWHDRKRILGMPISFTRYALSEDRLFLRRGFLNVRHDEIVLYRVRDLRVSVSLWQRIFGVGSVTVVSTDKSIPELTLKNIRQPNEVKELIHEHVEKMKIERRMRIGEMSMDMDDDSIDLEDINKTQSAMRRVLYMARYRSGHNGPDSKFLEASAVSSAENVRRTGLRAGSDFTISYRSCVFFLHSSGARITLE